MSAASAIAPAFPGTASRSLPTAAGERAVLLVLFIAMLASSVAFIEPSPHDGLMCVLVVVSFFASVRFERLLALPFALLLVWNAAGMMSLINVPAEQKAIQYVGTSIYLAIAAILFACLFAQHTMARLTAMRQAYVISAVFAVFAGAAGYFHAFPGAEEMFTDYGRAMGPFKDPNVYGPYLIWPALFLVQRLVAQRLRLVDMVALGILLFGLLLSFSRGAWFHFAVSCVISLVLSLLAAPTPARRFRILALSAVGIAVIGAGIVFLLSLNAIHGMFEERAHLIQSYDVGGGGRFRLQLQALSVLFDRPNGMGPFEFSRVYGLQQHNVYLQAFLVYGWVGGVAYVLLLLSTLWAAFRTVLIRTPWQPYLITALGAFIGEVIEGFVIDTDHWRHFFLLLGLIWGLAAATLKEQAQRRQASPNEAFAYACA